MYMYIFIYIYIYIYTVVFVFPAFCRTPHKSLISNAVFEHG